MKTFQNFLTDRKVIEESDVKDYEGQDVKDYLKSLGDQHGTNYLHNYKAYQKEKNKVTPPPEIPKGWGIGTDEAVSVVSLALKQACHSMERVNRFGIDDVTVEMTHKQETPSGTQIKLNLAGVAAAKDKDHIIVHLKKLMEAAKPAITSKGIKLAEILYNQLQILDEVDESSQDEPAIGLVHKHQFSVPMVVIAAGVKDKEG